MANIRSYNKFEYHFMDGTIAQNEPVNTFISGLSVHIDDKSISATPKSRNICFACGSVFEGSKCTCGNSDFYGVGIRGRYWHRREDDAFSGTCYINGNNIVSRKLSIDWDVVKNAFVIQEMEYDILSINSERITANKHNLNRDVFASVFNQYVQRPEWDGMRVLLARFPLDVYNKKNNSDCDLASYMMLLQNVYNCIPNVENLSEELFHAIINKFPSTSGKFDSLAEFYQKCDVPMALADLYGILGVPSCSSLSNIDKLHPTIIMAIQYALLHHHITYNELSFIGQANIDMLNDNCYEFADYFRRNALKFGSKIYDAYLYVIEEGTTNIKEANMMKFVGYLRSKKFKEPKICEFSKNMENGDALAALKALL